MWAEPLIFTLPFLCLVLDICPYGMDRALFFTHFVHVLASCANSTYYSEGWLRRVAFMAKTSYRVLWFTSCKAVINTLMVVTGFKNPGHFKFTPKAGLAAEGDGAHVVGDTRVLEEAASPDTSGSVAAEKKKFALKDVHDGLSKITETRKACMPLDGTFDVWVLVFFMTLSLFSAAVGVKKLVRRDALIEWNENRDSLLWLGVAFALVDATPGLLFLGCAAAPTA